MVLYMDINYLTDNNDLYQIYILDSNQVLSKQIDEETFYNLFSYLYDRIFINYLLIMFFFTCGSTIFICNYSKRKKEGYRLIKDEEPVIVKGDIIEKV